MTSSATAVIIVSSVFPSDRKKAILQLCQSHNGVKKKRMGYGYNEADNTYGKWNFPLSITNRERKVPTVYSESMAGFQEGQIYRDDTTLMKVR
jgi:hypothetical protein